MVCAFEMLLSGRLWSYLNSIFLSRSNQPGVYSHKTSLNRSFHLITTTALRGVEDAAVSLRCWARAISYFHLPTSQLSGPVGQAAWTQFACSPVCADLSLPGCHFSFTASIRTTLSNIGQSRFLFPTCFLSHSLPSLPSVFLFDILFLLSSCWKAFLFWCMTNLVRWWTNDFYDRFFFRE